MMSNLQLRSRILTGLYENDEEEEWSPGPVPTLALAPLLLHRYRMVRQGIYGLVGCGDGGCLYAKDSTGLWRADMDQNYNILGWTLVDASGNLVDQQPEIGPSIVEDMAPLDYYDVVDALSPVWDGFELVRLDAAEFMKAAKLDSVEGEVFRLVLDGDKVRVEAVEGYTIIAQYDPRWLEHDHCDGIVKAPMKYGDLCHVLEGLNVEYQSVSIYRDSPCIAVEDSYLHQVTKAISFWKASNNVK
jgi:hypothetical protein